MCQNHASLQHTRENSRQLTTKPISFRKKRYSKWGGGGRKIKSILLTCISFPEIWELIFFQPQIKNNLNFANRSRSTLYRPKKSCHHFQSHTVLITVKGFHFKIWLETYFKMNSHLNWRNRTFYPENIKIKNCLFQKPLQLFRKKNTETKYNDSTTQNTQTKQKPTKTQPNNNKLDNFSPAVIDHYAKAVTYIYYWYSDNSTAYNYFKL